LASARTISAYPTIHMGIYNFFTTNGTWQHS
jgi:hypothetical protein